MQTLQRVVAVEDRKYRRARKYSDFPDRSGPASRSPAFRLPTDSQHVFVFRSRKMHRFDYRCERIPVLTDVVLLYSFFKVYKTQDSHSVTVKSNSNSNIPIYPSFA